MQEEFPDGTLAEECTSQTVTLIFKDTSGEFKRIKLVDVLWKTVTSLLNRRIMAEIMFHDMLHGFQEGCGMGDAALESKLIQQLTEMRESVLF